MSDEPTRREPDDEQPNYYADVSGTPEDTPDSPRPEPPPEPEPEVRRVRAEAPAPPPPTGRRTGALVGAGFLAAAALVGSFALGRATADDGGPDSPAAPFGHDGDWGEHHRPGPPGHDFERPGPGR